MNYHLHAQYWRSFHIFYWTHRPRMSKHERHIKSERERDGEKWKEIQPSLVSGWGTEADLWIFLTDLDGFLSLAFSVGRCLGLVLSKTERKDMTWQFEHKRGKNNRTITFLKSCYLPERHLNAKQSNWIRSGWKVSVYEDAADNYGMKTSEEAQESAERTKKIQKSFFKQSYKMVGKQAVLRLWQNAWKFCCSKKTHHNHQVILNLEDTYLWWKCFLSKSFLSEIGQLLYLLKETVDWDR